jgi:hypothetical protein
MADGTSNATGMIIAPGSNLQTATIATTRQTAAIERTMASGVTIVTGTAIKATEALGLTIPATDIPATMSVSSRLPGPRFSKSAARSFG